MPRAAQRGYSGALSSLRAASDATLSRWRREAFEAGDFEAVGVISLLQDNRRTRGDA